MDQEKNPSLFCPYLSCLLSFEGALSTRIQPTGDLEQANQSATVMLGARPLRCGRTRRRWRAHQCRPNLFFDLLRGIGNDFWRHIGWKLEVLEMVHLTGRGCILCHLFFPFAHIWYIRDEKLSRKAAAKKAAVISRTAKSLPPALQTGEFLSWSCLGVN
jgi:hypothetical protein